MRPTDSLIGREEKCEHVNQETEREGELGEESTGRNLFNCPEAASELAAVQGRSHTHTHVLDTALYCTHTSHSQAFIAALSLHPT